MADPLLEAIDGPEVLRTLDDERVARARGKRSATC